MFPADRETGTKICTKCRLSKPLGEFYWDKKRDAPEPKCKSCVLGMHRAKREKNPELYAAIQRRKDLRAKFGITPEEYDV